VVIPPQVLLTVGTAYCLFYATTYVDMIGVGNLSESVRLVYWLSTVVYVSGYGVLLFHWEKHRSDTLESMATFTVHDCVCFCEQDRPFVFGHIALLMRSVGECDESASQEEALDAFDALVRDRIGKAMFASIGPSIIPWRMNVVLALVCGFPYRFDCSLEVFSQSWQMGARFLLLRVWEITVAWNLMGETMALNLMWVYRHTGRRWCATLLIGSFINIIGWMHSNAVVVYPSANHYMTTSPSVFPTLIFTTAGLILTFVIYSGTHRRKSAKARVVTCLILVIYFALHNYFGYLGCLSLETPCDEAWAGCDSFLQPTKGPAHGETCEVWHGVHAGMYALAYLGMTLH